jgi:hypothetical protein
MQGANLTSIGSSGSGFPSFRRFAWQSTQRQWYTFFRRLET